jgi:hypothetical protein
MYNSRVEPIESFKLGEDIMENKNLMSHIFKLLILMFSIVFIFTCCLSTEEEESTPKTAATLTADNAPASAGAAVQVANVAGAFSSLGGIGVSSASTDDHFKSPLQRLVDKALSMTELKYATADLFAQGSMPQTTISCTDGGTMTMSASWIGPDQPSDPSQVSNFTATITLSSCTEGTETQSGSFTIAFAGSMDSPTGLTLSTTSLTFVDTATGDNLTMANLTMSISIPTMSGDEITGGTFSLNGSISGSVDGDPINQEYDNFQIIASSDGTGETLSMSGSLRALCLGGWVTIATDIPMFIPIGADCPTAGEVTVTSGENTVWAVVASNSTITVYFNGDLVQIYTDCEEVDGLCT